MGLTVTRTAPTDGVITISLIGVGRSQTVWELKMWPQNYDLT